jgi:hypothetical protein
MIAHGLPVRGAVRAGHLEASDVPGHPGSARIQFDIK